MNLVFGGPGATEEEILSLAQIWPVEAENLMIEKGPRPKFLEGF